MLNAPPEQVKLFHIVHVSRLASILRDGHLYCDSLMADREECGATIGMSTIKLRRQRNYLTSHKNLTVSECVPFYFCPRSVMLYLLYMCNHPDLEYRGGQTPILHLQFDLLRVVDWANAHDKRWAFTLSNAGAKFFEDRSDLAQLFEVNWEAVRATDFRDADIKEGKQAEFLVEKCVPWQLVEEIGVHRTGPLSQIEAELAVNTHRPPTIVHPEWYY